MSKTILSTVKVYCNSSEVDDFDNELVARANQAIMKLAKIGGCPVGTSITPNTKWDDILTDSRIQTAAEGYVGNMVQMEFDPPASPRACEAITENIKEMEWTIQQIVEGFLS